MLPVAREDNGVVVNAPPPPPPPEDNDEEDLPTCTVFSVEGDSGADRLSSLRPASGDGGADIFVCVCVGCIGLYIVYV